MNQVQKGFPWRYSETLLHFGQFLLWTNNVIVFGILGKIWTKLFVKVASFSDLAIKSNIGHCGQHLQFLQCFPEELIRWPYHSLTNCTQCIDPFLFLHYTKSDPRDMTLKRHVLLTDSMKKRKEKLFLDNFDNLRH